MILLRLLYVLIRPLWRYTGAWFVCGLTLGRVRDPGVWPMSRTVSATAQASRPAGEPSVTNAATADAAPTSRKPYRLNRRASTVFGFAVWAAVVALLYAWPSC